MPPTAKLRFLLLGLLSAGPIAAADYPVQPVPFTSVRITGGFWQERQETNRTVTVPFALQQCEDTGRIRNFDLAAETMRRRGAGEKTFQHTPPTRFPFDDSDVFKAVEGAAYALARRPDPALARQLDGIIARIAAAQEPDGYLYTFRTMHPDTPAHPWIDPQRWLKDPEHSHELYNIGHLFEAGFAHFEATGQRTLLDVSLKAAGLLWRDFGDGRLRIAPGHQVIEMGLVKLYRATGDQRWLQLARIFLEARGPGGPTSNQRHQLVVDQTVAVGHAVRANYLYAGMADVAALTGDQRYASAITKIWDNVVQAKYYLTGGVGALGVGETYGADFELPVDGYNESCAAIAFMMWNHRMFLLTGDGKYIDTLERTMFNGALSGVSLSGDRFFYPNPLVSDGVKKFNQGYPGRAPWFGCACCPPNLMRTIAALSGYFYAVRERSLFVNSYAPSAGQAVLDGTTVNLVQTTDYPWDGAVRLAVSPARPAKFALLVRIPGWVQGRPVPSDLYTYDDPAPAGWSVRVNGMAVPARPGSGYVAIEREWHRGDVVELNLPMSVRTVRGHAASAATHDRIAFERGPLVYCVEDPELKTVPADIAISPSAKIDAQRRPGLCGGVMALVISRGPQSSPLTAIPYYAWDNRGVAAMAVWLRRAP